MPGVIFFCGYRTRVYNNTAAVFCKDHHYRCTDGNPPTFECIFATTFTADRHVLNRAHALKVVRRVYQVYNKQYTVVPFAFLE